VIREEALGLLTSTSTHLRLKASRFLARNAQSADLLALRQARATESDSYVKGSLERGIARLTDVTPVRAEDPPGESEISEKSRRQIYADATEWVAGLILHEIASPLGLLALAASREFPNFDGSRTKGYLDALQKVFGAIEQLKTASATPKPEEFDLANLIGEIVASEFADSAAAIATQGPKPLLLLTDAVLLRFAICNGLRNAVEAVTTAQIADPFPIVITWGETDVDHWVAVLDRGPGIAGPIESVFGIGTTTKKGHSGFGLAIARAAIEALDGTVTLQMAAGGGTRYELRWEK